MIYTLAERRVELLGSHHYIAPNATLIGSVVLGNESSIWFNVVIRGDSETITIGARSNVQDGSVLHADPGVPLVLAPSVSVGHLVMLHGCTIGEGTLVGIKAVVLNHAQIGRDCLIGANALVTEGKVIPDRSVVMGSPGKVVRTLTDDDVARLRATSDHYVANARRFLADLRPDVRG